MEERFINALALFGFKLTNFHEKSNSQAHSGYPTKLVRQRFVKQIERKIFPFERNFKSLNLVIDFTIPEPPYHESTLSLIDASTNSVITFETGSFEPLLVKLIDSRSSYENVGVAHHISKVITKFNSLTVLPIEPDFAKLEMYAVCKKYEKGFWRGADRDCSYTTYIEYSYFLILDGYIIKDEYLDKIVQKPWRKEINSRLEFGSVSDVVTDDYWIEKADDVLFDLFKINYNGYEHQNVMKAIMK